MIPKLYDNLFKLCKNDDGVRSSIDCITAERVVLFREFNKTPNWAAGAHVLYQMWLKFILKTVVPNYSGRLFACVVCFT